MLNNNIMVKNFGYKVVITILTLCFVTVIIAYSPVAYVPTVSATATLNFGATLPATSSDLTMTVTGAALGDVVMLGVPNGSMPANGGFIAWISASNTATVRYFNMDALSTLDPASGSFRITVYK